MIVTAEPRCLLQLFDVKGPRLAVFKCVPPESTRASIRLIHLLNFIQEQLARTREIHETKESLLRSIF